MLPSTPSSASFCSNSWRVSGLKCASLPSESTILTSSRWSRVLPYIMECEPHELLPIMPPIMHRLAVDVSGPKKSPCSFMAMFSSSKITPGCTRTQCSCGFTSRMEVMCFEISTTIPLPTTCPANEVPAVRGISGILCFAANWTAAIRSARSLGHTTAVGRSLYAEASVEYMQSWVESVLISPAKELASSFMVSDIINGFINRKFGAKSIKNRSRNWLQFGDFVISLLLV